MPEQRASAAQRLCASAELGERGRGVVFDLLLYGRPARGFALRIDGRAVGYVNQCAHVPVEMDWREGEFLDLERRWIVCAVHGATYDPRTGHCVAGPCVGARLKRIALSETDGSVYWYPSPDLSPTRPAEAVHSASPR
jgi:nitrite reductase/ring-hydroxylating ferredoxin subunit